MAVSAKNYRFISPGIVTQEIDRSRIPNAPQPIGPVIIGRAERGPSFTPVTVSSFADYVNAFGNPVAGGNGGDVWRDGNKTSPMYGTYAAQAWLKNGEVLTYLRTLGVQSQNATSPGAATTPTNIGDPGGYAGWRIGVKENGFAGGAYGLFVFPSGTMGASNSFTGSLAAVWYTLTRGAGPVLSGTVAGTTTTFLANNTLIESDSNGSFFVQFSNTTNAPTDVLSFSLNKDKNNYIRKVFNTDPTLLRRDGAAKGQISYFLGETFEDNLFRNSSATLDSNFFTASSNANSTKFYGVIAPLVVSGGYNYSDRLIGALTSTSLPKSGWVISQDTSQNTGSFFVTGSDGTVTSSFFTSGRVSKLFRFVGLNTGEWLQNNLKVSIANIQPPLNESVDPYATFDVQLRLLNDSDKSVKIVESFTGCTLNAKSDSFIMAKIGDKYIDYDETNQRLREYGSYENKSKYIRVEMAPGLENGTSTLVPFGTTLPNRLATFTATSGSVFGGYWIEKNGNAPADSALYISASTAVGGYKISFPSVPYRTRTALLNSPLQAYWGAAPTQDSGEVFVPAVKDALRIKPRRVENYDTSDVTEYSNIITLDNVRYETTNSISINPLSENLTYDQGARKAGLSLTATGALPTNFPQSSLVLGTYKAPLVLGANKFTSLFKVSINSLSDV